MTKTLFVAVWACLVTLGASYGVGQWMKARAISAASPPAVALEARKTKEINVPIIRDGSVKGYVVTQLSYIVDLAAVQKLPTPPEVFVVDEIFRYIYEDEKIDFAHLDKLELDKMTRELILRINTRLKADVITEMGVQECNFLLNAESKPKI